MKKFNFTLLVCLLLAGIFASCDDDDKYPVPPEVSIESVNGVFAMPQEDSIVLKAKVESPLPTTLSWSVKGNEVSKDTVFTFKMNELGTYDVKLTATNADGVTSATTSIEVYGKYKYGTFVLNEGYQADPSTLIFISPKGILTDSAYYKANGSMLSLLSQDLFIANNKLYIISQKSGDDGYLIVANAETLKKEAGYKTELEDKVSSPTHVAVLGDDDIYLRDNEGIKVFHPSSGELFLIEGAERANKNTMAVTEGKIFAAAGNNVLVIEKGKNKISKSIEFNDPVRGVVKSSDGNLWVSTSAGEISKVDAQNYTIIKTNTLPGDAISTQSASYTSTPCITAQGDTLYMNGTGTKIYRHIFSKNQTDLMVDAANIVPTTSVYNTIAVNPVTGEVYLNTIKGWGNDRLINHISVFDFSETEPKLSANYKNHTNYPAGTFFTYNFQ